MSGSVLGCILYFICPGCVTAVDGGPADCEEVVRDSAVLVCAKKEFLLSSPSSINVSMVLLHEWYTVVQTLQNLNSSKSVKLNLRVSIKCSSWRIILGHAANMWLGDETNCKIKSEKCKDKLPKALNVQTWEWVILMLISSKKMVPLVYFSQWNCDDGTQPLANTLEMWTFLSSSHFIKAWNLHDSLPLMSASNLQCFLAKHEDKIIKK